VWYVSAIGSTLCHLPRALVALYVYDCVGFMAIKIVKYFNICSKVINELLYLHSTPKRNTMTYKKTVYKRRSIRLRGYDYSQQGLYFITMCTQNRACIFGNIEKGNMFLHESGEMVLHEWLQIPKRFPNIVLHEHIIMPNHIHVILQIVPVGAPLVGALDNTYVNAHDYGNVDAHDKKGQPQGIAPTALMITIGDIIGAFKSITTNAYIRGVKTHHWKPFD
jgi:putative transposase